MLYKLPLRLYIVFIVFDLEHCALLVCNGIKMADSRLGRLQIPILAFCIFINTMSSPFTMTSQSGSIYDPPIFVDNITTDGEPVSGVPLCPFMAELMLQSSHGGSLPTMLFWRHPGQRLHPTLGLLVFLDLGFGCPAPHAILLARTRAIGSHLVFGLTMCPLQR